LGHIYRHTHTHTHTQNILPILRKRWGSGKGSVGKKHLKVTFLEEAKAHLQGCGVNEHDVLT
jgi:hypothetical protein